MAASLCEVCGQRQQVTQGLCHPCILEGFRKIKDEGDPNLGRYLTLCKIVRHHEPKTLERVA